MISIDTETTGLDIYHGCRPFFVSTCDDKGTIHYWEWDVNPNTRKVIIPEKDLYEIKENVFDNHDELILHNAKFDISALKSIGLFSIVDLNEVWKKIKDTQILAHVLKSNQPKNLTSLAITYLNINILKYENNLEESVKSALSKIKNLNWNVAKRCHPNLPSCKEKTWTNDYWIPRAVAKYLKLPKTHQYWSVLKDYALLDAEITILLYKEMSKLVTERKLHKLVDERMKLVKITHEMENRGITLSKPKLDKTKLEFNSQSEVLGTRCINIAKNVFNTEIELPKGGINNSLREFLIETLELPKIENKKAKTSNPSFNKSVMSYYLDYLPENSPKKVFIKSLLDKRARNTAVAYMEGYERFWLQMKTHKDYYVLHPFLNLTGTDTLRCSSSNPNEQNIAKKEGFNLRKMFGPSPGREWWSIDAENIELKIPFYESKETSLIDLFEKPNEPPYYGSNHLMNFSVVYPDIWNEALKEVGIEKVGPYVKKKYASTWYQRCKNGAFAIQYGAMDRADGMGTADNAFGKKGCHALLKSRFKKLEELSEHYRKFANKHGYVETLPDKFVDPNRGYPLYCEKTEYGNVKPTLPFSYHIQGTAMWWTGRVKIESHKLLSEWYKESEGRFDGYLIMEVHDEVVFDFPSRGSPLKDFEYEKSHGITRDSLRIHVGDSNLWRIRILQKLMKKCGDGIGIPTTTKAEYHEDNWSEGIIV